MCLFLMAFCFPLISPAAEKTNAIPQPRVFLMDKEALLKARERVAKNDPKLKPALEELIKNARKALKLKAPSVMDKSLTPASGDKHDYMSFGPYWWPNSSEKDRPYIRRDGEVNPTSKDGSTDPVAMKTMTSAVDTLALAYYLTGRKEYAQKAAELLRTWFLAPATQMHPHMRFAQAIPGITEGRGAGIIDAVMLAKMLDSVGLLAGSSHWTTKDQRDLEAWFRDFLQWLQNSKSGGFESRARNNHGSWYDFTVSSCALFVNQTNAAKEIIEAAKHKRIDRQIEPDGRQPFELTRSNSFHYSVYNLEALWHLATLGQHVQVDLWQYESKDGRSLRKALDFLTPYADSGKKWPYSEIRAGGKGFRGLPYQKALPSMLKQAALIYKDEHYLDYLSKIEQLEEMDVRVRLLYAD
ncbi:MAG: Alginate lyase [Pedosphaera sp.]|nr:Alginate lyase [Pedosphaera sp.]